MKTVLAVLLRILVGSAVIAAVTAITVWYPAFLIVPFVLVGVIGFAWLIGELSVEAWRYWRRK